MRPRLPSYFLSTLRHSHRTSATLDRIAGSHERSTMERLLERKQWSCDLMHPSLMVKEHREHNLGTVDFLLKNDLTVNMEIERSRRTT